MNKEENHPEQYQPKPHEKYPFRPQSRETAMRRAMERKTETIQRFVDAKNVGMTAFASIRDSAQLCTALIATKAIKPEEYEAKFDDYFYQFLEAYSDRMEDAQKFFEDLRAKVAGQKAEKKERAKDEAEHDAGILL